MSSSQLLQRKYIDLVYKISSKWVNWDPPIDIQVGSYGTIDKNTGDFQPQGNIYHADFQQELNKHGIKIRMADYPPREGPLEDDITITSSGVKRREVTTDNSVGVANLANVSLKGEWSIESGTREAILIMKRPRLTFLPTNVILEHLYKVDKLIDKWLVTKIHTCPAYSMYLSDKSGDKVSLELVAQAPVAGAVGATATVGGGFSWFASCQGGLLRKACDDMGNYSFTPLFALRRPIKRFWRLTRDSSEPDPTGDDLWHNDAPPWDPLDEDGEEDAFSPSVTAFDPFRLLQA